MALKEQYKDKGGIPVKSGSREKEEKKKEEEEEKERCRENFFFLSFFLSFFFLFSLFSEETVAGERGDREERFSRDRRCMSAHERI